MDLVVSGVQGVQEVEEAVRQSQNQGRVYLIPHLGQDDLIAAYSGAELFIFPSLEETFGFPPVEAMACGAPVVASNASCIPEVLGDAAYFVDTKEPKPLAEAIAKVLQDKNLRENLIQKGKERAAQFKWEKAARETLAVYEEAIR
ncbi:MAG: glycosyltransferase, partial [Candidatus Omnitrophica bacterium]|nr:glycosyltransferase [Candidatus Omnitrophota bacterium]